MDSTLVSARIPAAKKERGCAILASLGSTTSDLINNAFDYVISKGQLPLTDTAKARTADEFAGFLNESTLAIDWESDLPDDYKTHMAHERLTDYESLA